MQDDAERQDDYLEIRKHTGRYAGKRALVVLGGPSAAGWERLADEIKPDVLIGANGVNAKIQHLNYWVCAENMNYSSQQAALKVERYVRVMEMFQRVIPAVRMVNHVSAHLLTNKSNVLKIDRDPRELDEMHTFSFRQYQNGLLNGALMQRPDVIKALRAGTVGLQCIHLAGILGVDEVHTIGYDLQFRGETSHHWYQYPPYEENKFYKMNMFTTYRGVETLWFWYDTAVYLLAVRPQMEADGLHWVDHSDGLIQRMEAAA